MHAIKLRRDLCWNKQQNTKNKGNHREMWHEGMAVIASSNNALRG